MKLADIVLRPARRDDAPILAAMSRDLIETGLGWHYRPERVAKFLDDPDTVTVVGSDRRRTVAFAIAQVFDEHAHIVLLAVQPSHQQRGIGRQMIEWVVASALIAGVASVHVELRAGNRAARALYKATGFSETLRLDGYYSGRETALRMMRWLRVPGAQMPVWSPPPKGVAGTA
ncbi:MAG: GNAT family N-acetyltransferase [Betaproteobacteria bacterium]